MDNKEYISSGILELYAAGLLNEDETIEVEKIIKDNPEIKNELEEIQKTISLSLSTKLKSPSPKIKIDILNQINKPEDTSEKIHWRKEKDYSKEKTISKSSNTYRYLLAANIAFLILSIGTNFFLFNKLNDAKREIVILNDQKRIMAQEFEAVNRKLSKASNDMAIMADRTYKVIDMKGLDKSPSSNVLAFWNPETKKVYVEVVNLPIPPANKQYQLWALDKGKPIDAGVMDVDPSDKSLHEMKSIDNAEAFAITLEPRGGSINPTMSEMYVMGKL